AVAEAAAARTGVVSGGEAVRVVAAKAQRFVANGCDVYSHPRPWLVVRGNGDRLLLAVLARLPPDEQLQRRGGDACPGRGARGGGAALRAARQAAVFGDGQRAVVHRTAVREFLERALPARADRLPHAAAVGSVGAISSNAQDRGGVLAVVRRSATRAGVPGGVSGALQSTASALGVATGGRRRPAGARGGVCWRRSGADPALANVGDRREGEVGRADEWRGLR